MKKGFTLLELLTVVIIIGILATITIAYYFPSKELSLDKEVNYNLKVVRAAEKAYFMDIGTYYPSAGSVSNITNINQNLRLSLSEAADRSWNYAVRSDGCVQATRNGDNGRSWYLTIGNAAEPLPGTCP